MRTRGPRRARRAGRVALCAALAVLGGCAAPGPVAQKQPPGRNAGGVNQGLVLAQRPQPPTARIDPMKVETRDDIVMVRSIWQAFPWLYDAESTPVGFQVPVYFVSGETEKGAFVPGKAICRMYRLLSTQDGETVRELIHEWTFNEQQASGFRTTKKFILGYCYGFVLTWPKEVRLAGQQVEIEFAYERLNGSVVVGTPRRLQVPAPGKRPPPATESSEHYVRSGGERVTVPPPKDPAAARDDSANQPRVRVRTGVRGETIEPRGERPRPDPPQNAPAEPR